MSTVTRVPVVIPVEIAQAEPVVDFRVKNVPPRWMRIAKTGMRVGSLLLVLAVALFGVTILEHEEKQHAPIASPDTQTHR